MFTHALILAAALVSVSAAPLRMPSATTCVVVAPDGGPPRISVANKASGDITKAEWADLKAVELHGCVPDARIVALELCIKDCTGRNDGSKGSDATLTTLMKTMIINLPAGAPFTVEVVVKDAKGKVWDVPDATYVWKG